MTTLLQGFAERKALLLLEVIQRCRDRHTETLRQLKARASFVILLWPVHTYNPVGSRLSACTLLLINAPIQRSWSSLSMLTVHQHGNLQNLRGLCNAGPTEEE